jgi:hypothetical protein
MWVCRGRGQCSSDHLTRGAAWRRGLLLLLCRRPHWKRSTTNSEGPRGQLRWLREDVRMQCSICLDRTSEQRTHLSRATRNVSQTEQRPNRLEILDTPTLHVQPLTSGEPVVGENTKQGGGISEAREVGSAHTERRWTNIRAGLQCSTRSSRGTCECSGVDGVEQGRGVESGRQRRRQRDSAGGATTTTNTNTNTTTTTTTTQHRGISNSRSSSRCGCGSSSTRSSSSGWSV